MPAGAWRCLLAGVRHSAGSSPEAADTLRDPRGPRPVRLRHDGQRRPGRRSTTPRLCAKRLDFSLQRRGRIALPRRLPLLKHGVGHVVTPDGQGLGGGYWCSSIAQAPPSTRRRRTRHGRPSCAGPSRWSVRGHVPREAPDDHARPRRAFQLAGRDVERRAVVTLPLRDGVRHRYGPRVRLGRTARVTAHGVAVGFVHARRRPRCGRPGPAPLTPPPASRLWGFSAALGQRAPAPGLATPAADRNFRHADRYRPFRTPSVSDSGPPTNARQSSGAPSTVTNLALPPLASDPQRSTAARRARSRPRNLVPGRHRGQPRSPPPPP